MSAQIKKVDSLTDSFINHLTKYSEANLCVITTSRNKIPTSSDWPTKASSEPEMIVDMWKKHPTANVGIATGPKSGIIVFDFDIKNGVNGIQSLRQRFPDITEEEFNPHVETPSGGLHLYFKWDENYPVTTAAGVLEGIDIRGDRGFVMAPPSLIEVEGELRSYKLLRDLNDIGPMPEWAKQLASAALNKTVKGGSKSTDVGFDINKAIEGVPEGERDTQLFKLACHFKGAGVPYELAVGPMKAAAQNCIPPFDQAEALKKLNNAYTKYEDPQTSSYLSNEEIFDTLVEPYTDMGNGERYARIFEDRCKFVLELSNWLFWNGKRWIEDSTIEITRNFKKVLESIRRDKATFDELHQNGQISTEQYEGLVEQCNKWHKSSQSAGKISAAINLASAQQGICVSLNQFDNKGYYRGVKNGVLNLKTRELVVDKPEYFITKSAGCHYDPDATCPNWLKLLDTTFQGDTESIGFIQRLFGQSMLGTPNKDKLIIMCGVGANGKSTITGVMTDILGDYALDTSASAIMQSKKTKDYFLAELKGVTLMIMSESDKGAYIDEPTVKMLVDSGKIQARQIYQAPITFQPVATPILTTNYSPGISADFAIRRRIIFVPFKYQIPETDRNPDFKDQVLKAEYPGILNWALDGCIEFQKHGLKPSKAIIEATNDYFYENDRIGRFLSECLIPDNSTRMKLQEVKAAYSDWAELNGFREVNAHRVGNELRNRGYEVAKRNNGLFHVLGLREKTDADRKAEEQEAEKLSKMVDLD